MLPQLVLIFATRRQSPDTMAEKDVDTMISLVMIDSATGYLHSVPLRSKNQWNLMVRELLGFTGILGTLRDCLLLRQ